MLLWLIVEWYENGIVIVEELFKNFFLDGYVIGEFGFLVVVSNRGGLVSVKK